MNKKKKPATLVLGVGVSGLSAAHFLQKKGERVLLFDDRPFSLPSGCERFESWEGVDGVVASPGIPPSHRLLQEAGARQLPIQGEVELAFSQWAHPILGVTGTNGKTTVTALTAHLLNQWGRKARAVGNIGVPLTSIEPEEGEVSVVELSSYQLDQLEGSYLHGAVLLNITSDHLDRYGTLEAYAQSKGRIARCLRPGGSLWVEEATLGRWQKPLRLEGARSFGRGEGADLRLIGEGGLLHQNLEYIIPEGYRGRSERDLLNVAAALALASSVVKDERSLHGLSSFQRPEHRLEWVTQERGVAFINDSKATNVAAVLHGVESQNRPVVLIAGGVHKGEGYSSWREPFSQKVKKVVAMGQAAQKIEEDLDGVCAVECCATLSLALERAIEEACEGDAVLLSPGCSSFDQFENYAHRGREFKRLVSEWEGSVRR